MQLTDRANAYGYCNQKNKKIFFNKNGFQNFIIWLDENYFYSSSYSPRNLSLFIIFSQSCPSAFSHNGFIPIDTLIIVSNCSLVSPRVICCGISILFFSTIILNSCTPSG